MTSNRRNFLSGLSALTAAAAWPGYLSSQASADVSLKLEIDLSRSGFTMPIDFTGLSYETAQLGHADFFSGQNKGLIALFQRLTPSGILRIGGNTSDSSLWTPKPGDGPLETAGVVGPDTGAAKLKSTLITPGAIDNLRDFIDRVGGWRIIYGLDLQRESPESAAAEAAYVAKTLGSRLICFQLGNEPDYARYPETHERWTFDTYWGRWKPMYDAVKKAVPGAKFGGPDTTRLSNFGAEIVAKKADLSFLSAHYYAEGPPQNPKMTLEYLLRRGADPAKSDIPAAQALSKISGLPFRMTEGNSCYNGGKDMVSNTLASALWGGDYMLQVAEAGFIGVNLHGGGKGLYTPIASDPASGHSARPLFYGMMLAQHFAGHTFVEARLSGLAEAQNVTAFACVDPGTKSWQLAIFNKAAQPVELRIHGLGSGEGQLQWLSGTAIDSMTGTTLGGSEVGPDGAFSPANQAHLRPVRGVSTLVVPGYTGAHVQG